MGISFDEVKEEDFLKIGGEKPAHLLIEAALIRIGGDGVAGIEYKKSVLKKAGWKHHELVSYTSKRKDATRVFNIIRAVLAKTEDKDAILEELGE
jgi:hypothetical protein